MDKESLIKTILESNGNLSTIEIPGAYKTDLDVAMAIAKKNGAFIFQMDSSTLTKEVILEALKSNHTIAEEIPDEFYDDKDVVTLIVSKNGHLLWKASDRLIDDVDVVKAAIQNDPDAIRFASKRLKESLTASANEQKIAEEEKEKQRLIAKVEEFKTKGIWWQDENIENSEKLVNSITPEISLQTEQTLQHSLPTSYLDLLKTQNGGRLIKRYYYLPQYHDSIVFEIDCIYGISDKENNGIVEVNNLYLDYVNKDNVVIFGMDETGHAYYLFDYNDLTNASEPKVIYYDEELGQAIELASSFKEFIDNLKIHEEVDLIYW